MRLTDFLNDVGKGIYYYPKLSKITGGVKETIFLCQLCYWLGHQEDKDGWIYKTQKEMEEETGLSRKEQETARKNLKKRRLLREKYFGIPRKVYYLPEIKKINDAWERYIKDETKS